jgi:asparagine synthase (glutamine-hydrolysing)
VCGLITLLRKGHADPNESGIGPILSICRDMLDTLKFRGPDEQTLVQFGPAILGHTRLSIIDLSTGSQPIYNEDKTVAVVLNGEIYNFLELRNELESKGHRFSTMSDTEVIVHLYEEVGEEVFSNLNGMFAIVLYDLKRNLLLAGRDRAGEKPLVYWDSGTEIILASELKSILKHPGFRKEVDPQALALYFNCMYVPAPLTIFKGARKLPPAHYMKIHDGIIDIKRYWDPKVEIQWDLKEEEVVDEYISLFSDAVKRRIISDVPIGVFLSGGIDSSAVTAFMALHCTSPIKTYSVGFGDEIDERPFARLVAERYRTEHTELFVKDNIEDVVQKVISYFDEPFGDSSAIPTYMVSKEARNFVKVILTGDGGDELFAGYDSYIDQKYQIGGRVKTKALRTINELCVKVFGVNPVDRLYPKRSGKWAENHWRYVRSILEKTQIDALFLQASSDTTDFLLNNKWLDVIGTDALSKSYSHDLNFYLPDDLLKKVDMASMLTSLECRAPFLDHRLIEFSLKIPPQLKVKNDILKYLLKKALTGYLPPEILFRRKTGFGAPVESWLKNQLREMTLDILAPGCKCEQFLKRDSILKAVDYVLPPNRNIDYRVSYRLWLIVVFELWLREYL